MFPCLQTEMCPRFFLCDEKSKAVAFRNRNPLIILSALLKNKSNYDQNMLIQATKYIIAATHNFQFDKLLFAKDNIQRHLHYF